MRDRSRTAGWLATSLVLALALGSTEALSDGKVFGTAHAPIEMADQLALLHWKDGIETLVFGSSFEGKGADFAWVIPLPVAPDVTLADRGVLPTMAVLVQPRVVHRHWPGWGLLAVFVLGLGAFARVSRALRVHGVIRVGVLIVIVGFAVVVLLPVLATTGESAGPREAVRVLAASEVGDYTLTTLGGTDAGALVTWLRDHGYVAPDAALPAIAAHAKAGGVFVAAQLRAALADTEVRALQPLQFRFPTPAPIYPMALTGAGAARPLQLDLYVLGPRRAHAVGLRTVRCTQVSSEPVSDPNEGGVWDAGSSLVIGQPALRALAGDASIATHLRASFEPGAMQRDIALEWVEYSPLGDVVYTPSAARALAFDVWATLACVLLYAAFARDEAQGRPLSRRLPVLIVASCALGGVVHRAVLPTLDGELRSEHPAVTRNRMTALTRWLVTEGGCAEAKVLDRAWFAAACERLRASGWDDDELLNPFTGAPVAFEASPGNVLVLRRPDGSVETAVHDATGAPVMRAVVPEAARASGGSGPSAALGRFDPSDFRMAVRYCGWHLFHYGSFVTATQRHAAEIAALGRTPSLVAFVATPEEVKRWGELIGQWTGSCALRPGKLALPEGYEGYTVEIESAGEAMHAVLGWDVETYAALRDLDAGCWTTPGHGLRRVLAPLDEQHVTWVEGRYARLLGSDWHRIVVHMGEGMGGTESCAPVLEAVRELGGVRIRPAGASVGPGHLLPADSKELAAFQRDLHRFAVHHTVNRSGRSAHWELYAIDVHATEGAEAERIVTEHGAMPFAGGRSFAYWIDGWIARGR